MMRSRNDEEQSCLLLAAQETRQKQKIPKLIVKDFVSNRLGNQNQLNMISIGVKNHKNLKSSQVGQLQGGRSGDNFEV